jgi:hypothetical protein
MSIVPLADNPTAYDLAPDRSFPNIQLLDPNVRGYIHPNQVADDVTLKTELFPTPTYALEPLKSNELVLAI